MRFKHTCLDGQDRSGQELDCEPCRALLLNSFRGPDRPVDRRSGPRPEHWYDKGGQIRPAPLLPAVQDGPSAHVVKCRTNTYFGLWEVTCSCGWRTHGNFPVGEEASGRAVAEAMALAHAMDPEGDR